MPERRVLGGNRRDPRSELTSICAILYYCITSKAPIDLLGPDGKAPHRRIGYSIKEKLGASPAIARLEAFFDKGFYQNIDDRFQSIPEITSRLEGVSNPAAKETTEDPKLIASRVEKLLLKHNRNVQLAEYKKISGQLIAALESELSTLGSLQPYSIHGISLVLSGLSPAEMHAAGVENTLAAWGAILGIRDNPHKVTFVYSLIVKETQCGVFHLMFKHMHDPKNAHLIGVVVEKTVICNWEPIFWYDGLVAPDWTSVRADFKACVVEGMKIIEHDIMSGPTG